MGQIQAEIDECEARWLQAEEEKERLEQETRSDQ
jgi:hypothetical protein